MQRHETSIHGSNQHEGTASTTCESMQRNQIGGSALTTSQQEQVLQPEQQRVPIEYYQNIKNQLDHASSSNIQWQDAYKKLHMQWQEVYEKLYESGLELDKHLNEELRRMKNCGTQAELSKETIAKLLNML